MGERHEPAVRVEGLSKTFVLPHERMHTLKERVIHPLRGRSEDRLEALTDVSFEVPVGESFGIVGRNGSGKSTLLKCLAGIYRADRGDIWLRGRMAPFIELGVGFNEDLTARDNVIINAVMLGLSPKVARERYDAIIDFAELHQFQDLKLKNYSSGMQVRLAFSVMVQVDADLLLIDEVLAVGDAAFQQKCHDTLAEKRDKGDTILLVTHDMEAIERFCGRAMLLERGRIVELDDPRVIARRYQQVNFQGAAAASAEGSTRSGDRSVEIVDAWFATDDDPRLSVLEQGRPCSFHATVEVREPVENPIFGLAISDAQHRKVFVTDTRVVTEETGSFAPGDRVEMSVRFDNVLAPGRYFVTPKVAYSGDGSKLMDERDGFATVIVSGSRDTGGIVDLAHDMSVHRVGEAVAPAVEHSAS